MGGSGLLGPEALEATLRRARRIAVLGIKPESRRELDAHQIPLYLQKVGYEIVPLPLRYPEATTILGEPVVRHLSELRVPVDVLSVFAKPAAVWPLLAEIVRLGPGVVWFQSGLLEAAAAEALLSAGLAVCEDCIGCRRASLTPSWAPLHG
jgi:uncharacterized protein